MENLMLRLSYRESENFNNSDFYRITIYDVTDITTALIRSLSRIVASQWDDICENDAFKLISCADKLSVFVTQYNDGMNTVNLSIKDDSDLVSLGTVGAVFDADILVTTIVDFVSSCSM